MSTQSSRSTARLMLSPTVILLLIWMIVPLALTLWFSLQRYNLLYPDRSGFNWFANYTNFIASPAFLGAIVNTLILVVGVLLITVVVLIQTIFLLAIFGEILVTTNGGPGSASTTLPYLIYKEALLDFDAGTAAAGGVVAVILANIVAVFLMRAIGKNLDA